MSDLISRVVREPAALLALITLLLASGSIFNIFTLTNEQFEWVLALVGALLLVMRQYVTPVGDPSLPIGTIVNATNPSQPTGVVTPVEVVEETPVAPVP